MTAVFNEHKSGPAERLVVGREREGISLACPIVLVLKTGQHRNGVIYKTKWVTLHAGISSAPTVFVD